MRNDCVYLVGIDIGGTKCAVSLGEYRESDACPVSLVDKIRFDTNNQAGHTDVIRRILDAVRNLLARQGLEPARVAAAGISCGGPLDSEAGVIPAQPHRLGSCAHCRNRRAGNGDPDLPTERRERLRACRVEVRRGARRAKRRVPHLWHRAWRGADSGRQAVRRNKRERGRDRAYTENGPVGYGKAGSFEGFCSGGGILQIAKTMVLERRQMGEPVPYYDGTDASIDARQMEIHAREGDALARAVYAKCGEYLGRGLSILVDTLNPQVIVIGSIFTHCADLIWPHAKAVMDRECLAAANRVCRVVPAELGGQIGDYAAIAVAASAV